MNSSLKELYFKWLCSVAMPDENTRSKYLCLLNLLHSIPFMYLILLDENRLKDGIQLRYHFSVYCNIPEEIIYEQFNQCSCSVLEMIVALAKRCEDSIMSDLINDRTSKWFWIMIDNLGLTYYTDQEWNVAVNAILKEKIYNWLSRNYEPNGNGSLFIFKNTNKDMRYVEIWDQLNLYINENLDNNLF